MRDEEDIKRLLKSIYLAVPPPVGFRECLGDRLSLEVARLPGRGRSRLERPRVWLPIALGAISGAIGYGAWLSLNLSMLAR